MADCGNNSLLSAGSAYGSLSLLTQQAVALQLLIKIAQLSGSPATDIPTLVAAGRCYTCLNPHELSAIRAYLWVTIANTAGAGASTNPVTLAGQAACAQLQDPGSATIAYLAKLYSLSTTTDSLATLIAATNCYHCYTAAELTYAELVILQGIAGNTQTPQQLVTTVSCYICLTMPELGALVLYLIGLMPSAGCVPPEQPATVNFVGGAGMFDVSWTSATNPSLDFLVEWDTVMGPPFANSQSVAPNLRALNDVVAVDGPYFGRVTARNSASCVTVGTPDNDPFTVDTVPPAANMVLWLRGDDLTFSSFMDPIPTWPDMSGAGNTAETVNNPSVPSPPLTSKDMVDFHHINGHQAVYFGFDILGAQVPTQVSTAGALFTGTNGRTMYMVYELDGVFVPQVGNMGGQSFEPPVNGTWFTLFDRDDLGNGSPYMVGFNEDLSSNVAQAGDVPIVGSASYDGAIASCAHNDTEVTGALTLNTTATFFCLGCNSSGSSPFNGWLAEVIVYDAYHDATTRLAVINYLRTKYAI